MDRDEGISSNDYESLVAPLTLLAPRLEALIKQILTESNIAFHSVTARIKSRASVLNKLASKPDRYSSAGQLTDLLGVRIITYFADEVDKVGNCLVEEFGIDAANSIDKRSMIEPDKFGYLSMHYVAQLSESRGVLPEYRLYADAKFEIQIRSILQHAWAEVEHDLGYKAEGTVPREFRRRFSRLAGLLELADEEFLALRNSRDAYEEEVQEAVQPDVESKLGVDQATLSALINNIPEVAALDRRVNNLSSSARKTPPARYLELRATQFQILGIKDINVIRRLLLANAERIVELGRIFERVIGEGEVGGVDFNSIQGVSLYYLTMLIAAHSPDHIVKKWQAMRGGGITLEQTWSIVRPVEAKLGPAVVLPG